MCMYVGSAPGVIEYSGALICVVSSSLNAVAAAAFVSAPDSSSTDIYQTATARSTDIYLLQTAHRRTFWRSPVVLRLERAR
jgi:hypothetical protein